MSQHHPLDDESLPLLTAPLPRLGAPARVIGPAGGSSFLGFFGFSGVAAVVTMTLLGNTHQAAGVAAYFLNGNTLTVSRHALDLSRPIYLRDSMPVCPTVDDLTNYSAGNPAGCVLTQSTVPASLVAIVSDGMKQPKLQMELGKGPSAISGWVDYSNLTN